LNENGIPAQDIPGAKGQFDVLRDGEVVFSKQEAGRFPEHDEVLNALRE
jgi:selT/selW/selH-like putative selenoprotein